MKHSDLEVRALIDMCSTLGLRVDESTAIDLLSYLDALIVVNQRINLTRIVERDIAIRLHLVDSLSAVPEVLSAPPGRICDIGTGGGFPGVPIALRSRRACVLLDSVRRKAEAVESVIGQMGWDQDIHTLALRAEQHARTEPASYSVVTARAVAQLSALVELAAPLLSPGGLLVALKGTPTSEELIAGDKAAGVVGLERISNRELTLPKGGECRTIVTYRKSGSSRVVLPRREGLAQHAPLV